MVQVGPRRDPPDFLARRPVPHDGAEIAHQRLEVGTDVRLRQTVHGEAAEDDVALAVIEDFLDRAPAALVGLPDGPSSDQRAHTGRITVHGFPP